MQLTGQKWFTRSLSGSYKMTNGSRVRMKEAIKESVVHESTETHSRWACRGWRWWEAVPMSDVFVVFFHFSSALLIGYLQSDPRSHYLHVLAVTCAAYRGSTWILPRRQHAPNKRCALNKECVPDNPILRYHSSSFNIMCIFYIGPFLLAWSLHVSLDRVIACHIYYCVTYWYRIPVAVDG